MALVHVRQPSEQLRGGAGEGGWRIRHRPGRRRWRGVDARQQGAFGGGHIAGGNNKGNTAQLTTTHGLQMPSSKKNPDMHLHSSSKERQRTVWRVARNQGAAGC